MIKVPFNDLTRIHKPIRHELDAAWSRVVDHNAFILGSEVESFESEFAQHCDLKDKENAAGVDTGLSALELTLVAMGIGEGDEVITTANTFNATASAIGFTGAIPVLVDVDPQTHLMNPEQVKSKITDQTKAIIPVHLYGQQAEIETIHDLAQKNSLLLLEDACQAHGSLRFSKPPGSFGDAATFSFYPGKNLGAFGDGGMVISRNPELINRIKRLRDYGQTAKYLHTERGFNRRLDGLQAAILRVKLPHLDEWNASRRQSAEKLIEMLTGVGDLELPTTAQDNLHTYHVFVMATNKRDSLTTHLNVRGIQTGIHYPIPIHLQPAFSYLDLPSGSFPVTEKNAGRILSLPIFPFMKPSEINHMVDSIKDFYQK